MTVTFDPSNASHGSIKWESSRDSVASLSSTTSEKVKIYGEKEGTATITVTVDGKSDTRKVKIIEKSSSSSSSTSSS